MWKDSVAPLEASLTLWGVLERGLPESEHIIGPGYTHTGPLGDQGHLEKGRSWEGGSPEQKSSPKGVTARGCWETNLLFLKGPGVCHSIHQPSNQSAN